jgi:hypothetical protein
MKHAGDHKNYNTLVIKAFYKTVDRVVTLEPNHKDNNKSRLNIVQVTPLFDIDPPSDNPFNDFVLNITKSSISNTVIPQPRDLITNRQLTAKA